MNATERHNILRQSRRFRKHIIRDAEIRSGGICEAQEGCTQPILNWDHILSIGLGVRFNIDPVYLRSIENIQGLCNNHNQIKNERDYRLAVLFDQRSDCFN